MTFVVPVGMSAVRHTYGAFTYHELSGGNVDIDDLWERSNLVINRDVCQTGLRIQLHKLVMPHFEEAFADAIKRAPAYAVRMLGGYCARHMMHDATLSLSIHSWGAAFDVNWDANGVGAHAPHDLPAEFVAAFEERGWEWGGRWRNPDWMHFQLAAKC